MSFKDFVDETTVTKQGVYALNKGIPHLEDLPPRKFLEVIENIATYTITEKLDGANLVFGFDNDDNFFTSRETKNGKRYYAAEDYENRPANNGFKQAHLALTSNIPQLLEVLSSGESVEIEVLYGRQPNAIVYGSNHIAFLRMLPGDDNQTPDQTKIPKLDEALKGTTHVTCAITTTRDGMDLYESKVTEAWKFAAVPTVDPVKFVAVKLNELEAYKTWLKVRPWPIMTMTHEDVYNCKLNCIKKADLPDGVTKDHIKASRTLVREMVLEQHLQQKVCFIDLLRKLKPTFRDVHLEGFEREIGIEGVVLRHPDSGEQVKIVDKDGFTLINQFNHAVRNEIRSSNGIRRKFEATLGRDIDVYTGLLREFERILGVEGLGRLTSIKRIIRKHSGSTLTETIGNFTSAFKNQNMELLRDELSLSISKTLMDLAYCHGKYLLERYSYTLTLPTGRTIRYTDEINKRTELLFAETRKELKDMRSQVKFAETLEDIAQALYGKQLNSL